MELRRVASRTGTILGIVSCIGLGVAACGDDDGSGSDAATPTDGGGAVDGTIPVTDAGPEVDTGIVPGSCPMGDCDLIDQTGCTDGQSCYFLQESEGTSPRPLCDMSGTGGDGASCETYRDCAEGFFCARPCEGEMGSCRPYCCDGAGCPMGQLCAVALVDPVTERPSGVGYCEIPAACDPLTQTGCAHTCQGCYVSGEDGSLSCIPSLNNLAEGVACSSANDCLPGLGCFSSDGTNFVCHKFCDTAAAVAESGCAEGQDCSSAAVSGQPDLGICVAPVIA